MGPEKKYQRLKKKYKKLPNLKWLEENLNIKLEEGFPVLEQIRSQTVEKLLKTRDMIEPLIGASETYSSWFEKKMITQKEKEELFKIYKKLQIIFWKANKIGLGSPEKDYVVWIKSLKGFWDEIKPALTSIFEKIAVGWEKYHKKEIVTYYRG